MSTTVRVFSAADILVRLLAGRSSYRLSHMYIIYENSASPTPPVPQQSDTASSIRNAMTGGYDFIRAQLLPQPLLTASSGDYEENVANFVAVATADEGVVQGLPFSAVADSHVVGLAVVASPTSSYLQDVLYSYTGFDSSDVLPVLGSGQAGGTYQVTIE